MEYENVLEQGSEDRVGEAWGGESCTEAAHSVVEVLNSAEGLVTFSSSSVS